MKNRIKSKIWERTDSLSGRPILLQYARNAEGKVFFRTWKNGVIVGQGGWDKWSLLNGSIPASATATNATAYVPAGSDCAVAPL